MSKKVESLSAPWSREAEMAVLGSMLIDNNVILDVLMEVSRDMFYSERHRVIYDAICTLSDRGEPVDIVTIKDQLDRQKEWDSVGGMAALAEITGSVPTAGFVSRYIAILMRHYNRREIMRIGKRLLDVAANDEDISPEEVLAEADDALTESLAGQRINLETYSDLAPHVVRHLKEMVDREPIFANTEFGHPFMSVVPKELVVIAGRPSMGKTAVANQLAMELARDSKTVVFFSLEMGKESLVTRVLSADTGVSAEFLKAGIASKAELELVERAGVKLAEAKLNLFVQDDGTMTVANMTRYCQRVAMRRGKIDAVFVDYLQIVNPGVKSDNRTMAVDAISLGLKVMAKKLKVPVFALAQLSRQVEHRVNKRPGLADLREAGGIEQNADMVVFLYREGYYDSDADPGKLEFIVGKHRDGSLKTFYYEFEPRLMRFKEWDAAPPIGG